MSSVLSRARTVFQKYPLLRGVVMYSVTWPVSNLCQQAIAGKEKYDFVQAFRYSLYGAFYVAPTLHVWLRISGTAFPQMNLKTAVTKAIIEQFTYGPFFVVSFFFLMSLFEGKTNIEAVNEVKTKFLPTLKVAVCVWPIIQTVNFAFVPERNRMIYIGFCSMVWTCFLAYVKQQGMKKLDYQHS